MMLPWGINYREAYETFEPGLYTGNGTYTETGGRNYDCTTNLAVRASHSRPSPDVINSMGELGLHAKSVPPDELALYAMISTSREMEVSQYLAFFHLISRLKFTPRAGWAYLGIPDGSTSPLTSDLPVRAESIADHMYRMAMLSMLVAPLVKLDVAHCTHMALVHDLAECLTGDITPCDGIDKVEKQRRERSVMDWVFGAQSVPEAGEKDGKSYVYAPTLLPDSHASTTLAGLWREYERHETAESCFVHDLDKIELMLQAIEYERIYLRASLNASPPCIRFVNAAMFLRSSIVNLSPTSNLRDWAHVLLKERLTMWRSLLGKNSAVTDKSLAEWPPGQIGLMTLLHSSASKHESLKKD